VPALRGRIDRREAGLARGALTIARVLVLLVALGAGGCSKRLAGLEYRTLGASVDHAQSLVILLHGYGAPGDDLVGLARDLQREGAPEGTCFVVPVGPGGSGGVRYWFARDDQREQAVKQVDAFVGWLRQLSGLPRERIALAGFSQGGAMALEVSLRASHPPGTVVAVSSPAVSVVDTHIPLHVLLAHGRADPLVPFAAGEAMRAALTAKGHRVEWVEHPGGHRIPAPVREAIARFLVASDAP
jgi:phospholipase/carboxylesterase